jgi:hypothetical protein
MLSTPFPHINPAYHHSLFRVTDDLRTLSLDPSQFDVDRYRNLLRELCAALNASLEHDLETAIRYASDLTLDEEIRAKARSIVMDLSAFIEFIRFEEQALVACGASPESATAIAKTIAGLRAQLTHLPYDAGTILATVRSGKNEICNVANIIKSGLDKEVAQYEDEKRTMLTYGVALTLANAAGTAITAGAAAPFFALSLAGGGLLITFRQVLPDPLRRRPRRM